MNISIQGGLGSNPSTKVLYDMVKGTYHGFPLEWLVDESSTRTNLAPKGRVG